VDTLAQLDEVLAVGADVVLLDNMDPATLLQAVRKAAGRCVTEASGSITRRPRLPSPKPESTSSPPAGSPTRRRVWIWASISRTA